MIFIDTSQYNMDPLFSSLLFENISTLIWKDLG